MKKPALLPVYLLAGLMVLRPHFSGAAYPFIQGLFLVPALLGLALVLLAPEGDRLEFLKGEAGWVMALPWLLCLWSFLGIFWSADRGRGAGVSFSLLLGAAAFSLAFLITSDRGEEDGRGVFFLSLLILPVLARALYQHFFGLARLRGVLERMQAEGEHVAELLGVISGGRVFAGFLNSNMLAGFLAIFIPLTMDLALTSRDRKRRVLFVLLAGGLLVVLVLTGSIGGTLAAAAAAVPVFLVRKGIGRRELLWMAAVGVILIAGIGGVRGFNLLAAHDNSVLQRIGYMKAGLLMAAERPLLGWGPGSTPGALMGFVSVGVRPVTDPHNFLVRSWIAWGLPGVAALASFLFLWGKAVFGRPVEKGWRLMPAGYAGLAFGSAAFLLHSLMDMDFFVPETSLFGWVVIGGSLGMAVRAWEGPGDAPAFSGKGCRWFLAGIALALVIPSLVFLQGEFTAFKAGRAAEGGRLEEAASLFRKARVLLPINGHFALEEGRARLALGQKEEAAALFGSAYRLLSASPYPSWELGRMALSEKDWEGSIPFLETARERFPTSPRILLDLAQARFRTGDRGAAVGLLEQALDSSVFDREAGRAARSVLEGAGGENGPGSGTFPAPGEAP